MQSFILPKWIRSQLPSATAIQVMGRGTYGRGLTTVCKEARCPNQGNCFERRTATFLILGNRCTRNCSFCGIAHGVPAPLDPEEPQRVAEAVGSLDLRHTVITSVTRDDLPDGGAFVFAETVQSIRSMVPETSIEVLVPDFQGSLAALEMITNSEPDVIGHNLEMVPRLYPLLRTSASYSRSLRVLEIFSAQAPRAIVKSGIMVGLGETAAELKELMNDLATTGCKVLTIGQYLRPTEGQVPVERYVSLEEFEDLRELAVSVGIRCVVAGPLVRSSYDSERIFRELKSATHKT
jgi:lipoic acid synthetase